MSSDVPQPPGQTAPRRRGQLGYADTEPASAQLRDVPGREPGQLSERYAIVEYIGGGAFGDVYRAWDREVGRDVAVKVLRRGGAGHLDRFKREFRTAQQLVHPNLVTLYQLTADAEQWYFTMELVDGIDLMAWLRGDVQVPAAAAEGDGAPVEPVPAPACDMQRLRPTLAQLATAVLAIHDAGSLHRDLKPSNVLVRPDGRVVVLDFGLVTGLAGEESTERYLYGTVGYMAPEQAGSHSLTAAADWYSFGVMLFEALTGSRPFSGEPFQTLISKQTREAPAVRTRVIGAPEDLADLCDRVLSRDPEQRPGEQEMRAWAEEHFPAGVARAPKTRTRKRARSGRRQVFGRSGELRALHAAWEEALSGTAAMVHVHGPSGIGKTALVGHFVQTIEDAGRAAVLRGRCFERESVPYKALDGLIDTLVRRLREATDEELEHLVGNDLEHLERVFPAFQHLAEAMRSRRRGRMTSLPPDPIERRRRAVRGLQHILDRVSGERPLILWIDDLQWGDVESALLLGELMAAPWSQGLLVITAFRSASGETSACVAALKASTSSPDVHELALGPLTTAHATALATTVMSAALGSRPSDSQADEIAAEAGGNPFLIEELARHRHVARAQGERRAVTLESLLAARFDEVGSDARRLLEIVAVAGLPIAEAVACRAAGIDDPSGIAIGTLLSASLIRRVGEAGETVTPFHDRIREGIVQALEAETLRELHGSIASALERHGRGQPETLVSHFQAAGDETAAAQHAIHAARRAADALAFDRAATLYEVALGLDTSNVKDALALQIELATALANAGRGPEAADAYLLAAGGLSGRQELELQLKAAEQLLRAGHIDRGMEIATQVLSRVGVRLAPSPGRAVASMIRNRVLLRLRGLRHQVRDEAAVAPDDLTSIDACVAVGLGLGMVDTIRGFDVHTRSLLRALKVGEPSRVARAVAMEAGYHAAVRGVKGRDRTRDLLAIARQLAERVDHPHATAMVELMTASSAWSEGRWGSAARHAVDAMEILRGQCTGVTWELAFANIHHLDALAYMGDLAGIREHLPGLLAAARARGDLYAQTLLRLRFGTMLALADDDPAAAEQALEAVKDWSNAGYHVEHMVATYNTAEWRLYCGQSAEAWRGISEDWVDLRSSQLLRMQANRIHMHALRGRVALSAAHAESDPTKRRQLLATARKDARRIRRESTGWGAPMAALIETGAAIARDDHDRALRHAVEAIAAAEQADMTLIATVARLRRAEVERDEQRLREAVDKLQGLGIKAPHRLAAVVAPISAAS